jgi:hypothetical protein
LIALAEHQPGFPQIDKNHRTLPLKPDGQRSRQEQMLNQTGASWPGPLGETLHVDDLLLAGPHQRSRHLSGKAGSDILARAARFVMLPTNDAALLLLLICDRIGCQWRNVAMGVVAIF